MRRATSTLLNRVITINNDLRVLETDLRQHGDSEVADAVKRARRELQNGAVTGPANQVGVASNAIRP